GRVDVARGVDRLDLDLVLGRCQVLELLRRRAFLEFLAVELALEAEPARTGDPAGVGTRELHRGGRTAHGDLLDLRLGGRVVVPANAASASAATAALL